MIKLNDKTLEMISGGEWNVRTLNYDTVMEIRNTGMVVVCVDRDNPEGGDIDMDEGSIPMSYASLVDPKRIKIINGVPCVHIPGNVFLNETIRRGSQKIGGKRVALVELRHGHVQ